jgi:hypothetical protein
MSYPGIAMNGECCLLFKAFLVLELVERAGAVAFFRQKTKRVSFTLC